MAGGVVRLSTKNRTYLEDALKDSHHNLLIELWALRHVRWPTEVVQLENICAALRGRSNNLRRLYFCEAAGRKCCAETCHSSCRESQNGTPRRMTVGHDGMIEQRRDVCRKLRL